MRVEKPMRQYHKSSFLEGCYVLYSSFACFKQCKCTSGIRQISCIERCPKACTLTEEELTTVEDFLSTKHLLVATRKLKPTLKNISIERNECNIIFAGYIIYGLFIDSTTSSNILPKRRKHRRKGIAHAGE